MPKIHFVKNRPSFTVPSQSLLMEELLKAGLPVASSCQGEGICSKCRIQILKGIENLSPETAHERQLRANNKIPDGFRISCQTRVFGDITIDTAYW